MSKKKDLTAGRGKYLEEYKGKYFPPLPDKPLPLIPEPEDENLPDQLVSRPKLRGDIVINSPQSHEKFGARRTKPIPRVFKPREPEPAPYKGKGLPRPNYIATDLMKNDKRYSSDDEGEG